MICLGPVEARRSAAVDWLHAVSYFVCLRSVHSVMHQYLAERGEVTFRCIFSQTIGECVSRDYSSFFVFCLETAACPVVFWQ